MAEATAQKRALPARDRRESMAKRRASSPAQATAPTATPTGRRQSNKTDHAVEPPRQKRKYTKRASLVRVQAPTSRSSPTASVAEEVLPTRLVSNKPLPTLKQKQPPNLSLGEYQSIAESAILVASLQRSRMQWLCDGIFKKYWVKPVRRKGVSDAPPNNPDVKSMQKLGAATITIEPHVFDAMFFTVRDPAAPPPYHRHPNQHTAKQTIIPSKSSYGMYPPPSPYQHPRPQPSPQMGPQQASMSPPANGPALPPSASNPSGPPASLTAAPLNPAAPQITYPPPAPPSAKNPPPTTSSSPATPTPAFSSQNPSHQPNTTPGPGANSQPQATNPPAPTVIPSVPLTTNLASPPVNPSAPPTPTNAYPAAAVATKPPPYAPSTSSPTPAPRTHQSPPAPGTAVPSRVPSNSLVVPPPQFPAQTSPSTDHIKREESSKPHSAVQTPSQTPSSAPSREQSQTPRPAHRPNPPQGGRGSTTDPVIQMLAARAATDHQLKELMKVVATSKASPEQLREFQAHIDEFNEVIRRQEAERLARREEQSASRTPSHPPGPAPQERPKETKSEVKPHAPTPAASVPPPRPSPPVKPQQTPTYNPPKPPPRQQPGPTPPQAGPAALPGVMHTFPQPPPPGGRGGPMAGYVGYPAPPPPRPEPIIKHIVMEITSVPAAGQSACSDRWLFPEHAVLEIRYGGLEMVCSFFVERRGSDILSSTGADGTEAESENDGTTGKWKAEQDYYQPVTMTIKALNHRTIETIARAAKPLPVVQEYMKEVMEKKERAPVEYLVHQLPRERSHVGADGSETGFVDSGVELGSESGSEDDELKDVYGI